MTENDDRTFTRIDLATLERLATVMFDTMLDVQAGESNVKGGTDEMVDQLFSDIEGFKMWVTAMRELDCEGRVDR